jgi:hypothetical protein
VAQLANGDQTTKVAPNIAAIGLRSSTPVYPFRFVPARVSEKGLEAGWREHFKDATSVRDHAPVCIGYSLGAEDQVTWPCRDFRATAREDMFTLRT